MVSRPSRVRELRDTAGLTFFTYLIDSSSLSPCLIIKYATTMYGDMQCPESQCTSTV